jgi:uncharacterized phage protein (TIGR01671 family)
MTSWDKKDCEINYDSWFKAVGLLNQDNYIVQQCTGKYDIDEDLIYEGDIVCIPYNMYKAVVKYSDCKFYLEPINEWIVDWDLYDEFYQYKKVGNIMEDNNET